MQGPNCHPGPDVLTGFGDCLVPGVGGASRLDLCGWQVSEHPRAKALE